MPLRIERKFQLFFSKIDQQCHFICGLTYYQWNLHTQLFYWDMRKSVIFWLSPRFWTKMQNQLFFVSKAKNNKTNDTSRSVRAHRFQKWSIFFKSVEKRARTPKDPHRPPWGVNPTCTRFIKIFVSTNSSLDHITMNHVEKLARNEDLGSPGGSGGVKKFFLAQNA